MTGPRGVEISDSQFEELRFYADGNPRRRDKKPNTNLIRRNMLTRAPASGFYRITEVGRGALEARGVEAPERREFLCFPLITILAEDEEKAAAILFELEDAITAKPGVVTCLDEECYERHREGDERDEPWYPTRPESRP